MIRIKRTAVVGRDSFSLSAIYWKRRTNHKIVGEKAAGHSFILNGFSAYFDRNGLYITESDGREERVVRPIDFAPTVLDLAGAGIPRGAQGQSLNPFMAQRNDPDWDEPLYYHYYEYPRPHRVRRHYGIRTDRYKSLYYYGIGDGELFDLRRDPHELRNVVNALRHDEIVRNLKKERRTQRDQFEDPSGKDVPMLWYSPTPGSNSSDEPGRALAAL